MKPPEKIIYSLLEEVNKDDRYKFLLRVCEDIINRLEAEECIFYTLNGNRTELYTFCTIGKNGLDISKETHLGNGKGVVDEVALHHQSLIIEDTSKDNRYARTPDNKKSILAVPLMAFGSFLGVMEVVATRHKFVASDIDFIQPLANILALAVPRDNSEALLRLAEICIRFLEERDQYTHGHSLRVTGYSMIIAEELNLPESLKQELRLCALLHDIGKVTLKDSLLGKDTDLTKIEIQAIRMHPIIGYNIVSSINKSLAQVILCHHESYNGTGYPNGLKGEEIPLLSRIMGLADSFDAMTTDRPYRSALDIEAVIKEIADSAGKQFDPQVTEGFLKAFREGRIEVIKSF